MYKVLLACFTLLAATCCTTLVSHAQQYHTEKMSFQQLTLNDGLSQGMVNQTLQDHYGFMWFATKDGLNQYDGYHFRIFRHDTEDSNSLAESFVQSLLEDSKGRLWAGMASGNLDYFDQVSGKFHHVISEKTNHPDLPDGPINQVLEDKDGNIWIVYYDKLYVIKLINANESNPVVRSITQIGVPDSLKSILLFMASSGQVYLYASFSTAFYTYRPANGKWSGTIVPAAKLPGKNNFVNTTIIQILEDTSLHRVYVNFFRWHLYI